MRKKISSEILQIFYVFYVYFIYSLSLVPLFYCFSKKYNFIQCFSKKYNFIQLGWPLCFFAVISSIAVAILIALFLRKRYTYTIIIRNNSRPYINLVRRQYFILFYNSAPELYLECIISNPISEKAQDRHNYLAQDLAFSAKAQDHHDYLAQGLAFLINLRNRGPIYFLPEVILFWICVFTMPILGKDLKCYYYSLIISCLFIIISKLVFMYEFLRRIRSDIFNPISRSVNTLRVSSSLQEFLESEVEDILVSMFSYFRLLWRLLR